MASLSGVVSAGASDDPPGSALWESIRKLRTGARRRRLRQDAFSRLERFPAFPPSMRLEVVAEQPIRSHLSI
jgi:hypothetical protein